MAGSIGPIELPAIQGWDPRTGGSITRRFKGDQTLIAALALTHKRAGARIELTPPEEGGFSELRATYGAADTQPPTEPLADIWTLLGNDLEKDLWTHPKIRAEIAKADNPQDVATVRGEIEMLIKGDQEVTHSDGQVYALEFPHIWTYHISTLGTGMVEDTWKQFVGALSRGETSYVVSQWVLRHSLVVAANTVIKPALTNIDKIFSNAALVASENIPGTIKFDLPTGQWLKKAPTVEQESADKWRITQEWWYAEEWDSWVYDIAS